MAEREPPESTPREEQAAREGVRPVVGLSSEQRASTAQAFWQRIDAVEGAVRDVVEATRELAQRVGVGSDVVPLVAELAREVSASLERLRVDVDAVRSQVTRQLPATIDERIARIPGELGDTVGATVRSSVDAVSDRTAGALDGLRAAVSGLEERLAALVSGSGDATQTRLAAAIDALATQVRGVEDRVASVVASANEAGTDRLATALDSLATGIRTVEEGLEATVRNEALEPLQGLPRQLADAMGVVRDAVTEVAQAEAAVEERLQRLRDDSLRRTDDLEAGLADALTGVAEAVREDQERTTQRLTERVEAVRDAVEDTVATRLPAIEEAVSGRLSAIEDGVSGAISDHVEELRERILEELRGNVERLSERIGEAASGISGVTPTVADLGGRVETVLQSVDEFREEAGDLRAALVQVHQVANALESIGRRRGLKELAETDRRVAEQQAALVDRLTSAGETLTDRIEGLEEQLRAAVDAGELSRLQAEVTERIGAELERLRTSVAEEVDTRISEAVATVLDSVQAQLAEAVPTTVQDAVRTEAKEAFPGKALGRDLKDMAKRQREIDKVVGSVRTDLADVKKRIASWGKARAAPRLAQEVTALEYRVADVERLVQEELVEAVFERMERAFDRRFEALVQLVDSRLQQSAGPTEVDQRRGLFRRRE